MGGERAQRAGPDGRVCGLGETDRGGEGVSVRRDGQLSEQQEEAAQERAGPPHAMPPDTAAQPGYRAPLLLVLTTEGHVFGGGHARVLTHVGLLHLRRDAVNDSDSHFVGSTCTLRCD
jgi:hypothetical protein